MKKIVSIILGLATIMSICSISAFAASTSKAKPSAVPTSVSTKTTVKKAVVKKPIIIAKKTNSAKSDTGSKLTVKKGKSYQFKITATSQPKFVAGNSSVFKVTYVGSKGNHYYYKVTAVGKVGQTTAFYLNGSRSTVGTID